MAVNLHAPSVESLHPVLGVRLGFAEANIRKPNRKDVLLIVLDSGSAVSGVFTQNRFCAAPVQLCRAHLQSGSEIRALLVNTGCANAGTGEAGLLDAKATCATLAQELGVAIEQVLVFSTGVILERLPVDRLLEGVKKASSQLGRANWLDAAHAIMTTDTQPKAASRQIDVGGFIVHLTGISKGAGMICPNMATMLGYIATDAAVSKPLLDVWTKRLADKTFNRISVDGDTSTNDSFIVIATGRAAHAVIDSDEHPLAAQVYSALEGLAIELAQAIVRDGEGASKFITIQVEQAACSEEALSVAHAIAHSPLVKTAFYASDPNLGRILAAIGYAGISDLSIADVNLYLNDVWVAKCGGRNPDYLEADGQRVMAQQEITVRVTLGRGSVSETVWTCDFSHDYVSINANYRS